MSMISKGLEVLAGAAVVAFYAAFWSSVVAGAVRAAHRFCVRLLKGKVRMRLRPDEDAAASSISLIVYCYTPDSLGLSPATLLRGPQPRALTPMETIMRVGRDPRFVPCALRRPKFTRLPEQEPAHEGCLAAEAAVITRR